MKRILFALHAILLVSFSSYSQNLENISKEKPISFSSSINLQTQYYTVNGIDPRQPKFSYFLSGSPVVSVYGVQIPLGFVVSNQQFSYQQPFNQFGITPQYKWAKVHAGFSSMQFSPFTVAGQRFLGTGLELNPGKLRFGFMYGRLRRAVSENLTNQIDPEKFLYEVAVPAYERKGYAVKLGVGSENNYFDLVYFRGKDQISSIKKPTQTILNPQSNGVIGFSTQFRFFKKLYWKTDVGVSVYTRNMLADSIQIDSIISPFVSKAAKNFADVNSSSYFGIAGESSLDLREKNYTLRLQYRRIDPDYQSMGAYYFQQDIEQYTFSPSFVLSQGKLVLSGSGGIMKDNLKKLKVFTANRFIANANIAYNPNPKFGFFFNYSNFGFTQNPTVTSISDSSALKQVSHNAVLTPRWIISKETFTHVISPTFTYSKLADLTKSLLFNAGMSSVGVVLSYNGNWLPKEVNVGLNLLYRDVVIEVGKTSNVGVDLNASKNLFKGKLQATLGGSYYKNLFKGEDNGSSNKVNVNLSWALFQKHRMYVSGNWVKNTSLNPQAGRTFSEFYGQTGISLNF